MNLFVCYNFLTTKFKVLFFLFNSAPFGVGVEVFGGAGVAGEASVCLSEEACQRGLRRAPALVNIHAAGHCGEYRGNRRHCGISQVCQGCGGAGGAHGGVGYF